jgi:hypothetical protein
MIARNYGRKGFKRILNCRSNGQVCLRSADHPAKGFNPRLLIILPHGQIRFRSGLMTKARLTTMATIVELRDTNDDFQPMPRFAHSSCAPVTNEKKITGMTSIFSMFINKTKRAMNERYLPQACDRFTH